VIGGELLTSLVVWISTRFARVIPRNLRHSGLDSNRLSYCQESVRQDLIDELNLASGFVYEDLSVDG
jgi:hypothetical protein